MKMQDPDYSDNMYSLRRKLISQFQRKLDSPSTSNSVRFGPVKKIQLMKVKPNELLHETQYISHQKNKSSYEFLP